MITFPNAKINIGLFITARREDGFHNLSSCFYPVSWTDILEIIPSKETKFSSSGLKIPDDGKDNLCMRAYRTLQQDFDLPPVHIHLHKIIPIGAGLGGGSSDAAFTLKMLNDIFSLALNTSQLEDYARILGSDCAFFIENQPKYCLEKGDKFETISIDLQKYALAIIFPKLHISTREAYQSISPKQAIIDLKKFLTKEKNPKNWKNQVINDFELPLFMKYPVLETVKNSLYNDYEALYVSMTGSGSAIFGIFEKAPSFDNSFLDKYLVWQEPCNTL